MIKLEYLNEKTMTLILTAIYKDDICVCADTRYEDQKWSEGFKDGFDKIYKFNSYPIIILNHGVNKFNERYWDDICFDYEKSENWKNKNLKSISENFKDYIEPIVIRQLEFNIKHYPSNNNAKNSGFALCGKNFQNNNFEIYEFFWSPKPELPEHYPWNGIRLNGFGNGYNEYLKNNISVNWDAFNREQVEGELERLFSIARERKNCVKGKEFSDNFTIKSLMRE